MPLQAQELMRDFVRSRQDGVVGWPGTAYDGEDLAYFEMLERERIAGRLTVQGTIKTLADYEVQP